MNDAAPSAYKTMRVVALAQATLDSLREDHGVILETEAELRAALADEGVSVDALLAQIGRAVLDAAADVEAANARIDALCIRRDRAAKRAERLRDTLLAALQAIGMTSFRDAEFSASWRHGKPKLVITDVDELPWGMVDKKTTLVPDREMIRTALDAGQAVPGATMLAQVPPVLTIRAK